MKLSNFIDGISLLRPYYENPDGYHLDADHDVIRLYPTDRPLEPETVENLIALGWFQSEARRGEDGEFRAENYDPHDGWTAFT